MEAAAAEKAVASVSADGIKMLADYGFSSFRVDFSPVCPIPKKYGKRIKALGGKYSECRGHSSTRYVDLPMTVEGVALAQEMTSDLEMTPDYKGMGIKNKNKGKYTVVLEGSGGRNIINVVHYVARAEAALSTAVESLKAGIESGAIESNEAREAREKIEQKEAVKRAYEHAKTALENAIAAMKAEGLPL